jgi:N-acetylmuramoyl-L-alanine amidase
MRHIDKIIIHCSATLPGQRVDVETITRWHKQRGFKTIGYHFFIDRSGTIHAGRPLEQQGAHCKGQNAHSIGICYEGGLNKEGKPYDTRTILQRIAMKELVAQLLDMFPDATVHGHREFANKACPCFDVQELTEPHAEG